MRDVHIVGYARSPYVPHWLGNEVELLAPVVAAALTDAGLPRAQVGFSTLASSDFLAGQAFAFVRALEAMGIYPVADDSHVDMDGAFALYEAWLRLQVGDVDAALVCALGLSSSGCAHEIMPLSLDPYYLAPLGIDSTSLAALQARAMHSAGLCSDTALTLEPPVLVDAAAVIVLAAGSALERASSKGARILGIDQRIEAHSPGARDLTRSVSTELAAEKAGVAGAQVEVAELFALYPHEQILLARSLGLRDGVKLNPSGDPSRAHAVMATGLIRIGEAANAIRQGSARRAVAHATNGPCLQHNLVCVLGG